MLNLIAHCGANYVERSALGTAELPPQTETHTPIAHDYFIDLIEDRLNAVGLRIVNEAFAMGNAAGIAGANMFGLLEVAAPGDSDYATVIGARNSHAKKFSANLACGGGVFVCDNLAFSGEVVVGRRHTSFILRDLGSMVTDAIASVVNLRDIQDARYNAYKATQLSTEAADHVIVEMLRRGVINTQRIDKVVQQWDTPDHDEFRKTGDSGWRMFNAATEALKGTNVIRMPERTQKLHTLIDEVCEVDLAA